MLTVPSSTLLAEVGIPSLLAAVLLGIVAPRAIRASHWSPPIQRTVASLLRGPLLALSLAPGSLAIYQQFWSLNPDLLPSALAPGSMAVIAELIVVWTFVGAASLAARRHLSADAPRNAQFLRYGFYAAGLLGVVLILLTSPEVPRVAAGIWGVIGFGAGLLVTYLVLQIVNLTADRYFEALAHRQPGLETLYRFLRRTLMLVIVLLGVAISTYVNFPNTATALTSLILAAGFLSIVVGLAAQSTLSNLIAGAMISISQPFKIGDAVVFPYPNGDWCVVEDVRLNFTVLRTWDLRRLMVPNALFQSSVLVNYTAVDPTMLVIAYLVVSYDADVDRARAIMVEEARKHPDFVPLGNLPITHVMDYQGGANQGTGMYGGVDLRLLSAAKDQPTAFQVEKDLLHSIRRRFQQEGISLAYPTQRVILESPSPTPARPRGRTAEG